MPDAGELFGGFFDAVAPSPVTDALADAYTVLETNIWAQTAAPRTFACVLRADEAVAATAPDGRGVTAYPAPPFDPVWVATSSDAAPVLCAGVDFALTGTQLVFDEDPLQTGPVRTVWGAGTPVAALTAWGGTLGTPPPGPAPQPATYGALTAAVAARCGSPAAGGAETVAAVFASGTGTQVVTDRAVYRLGPTDVPTVAPGAVLAPGTPLGAAWALTKLGPAKPALGSVTTPAAFHQGATTGGITWYDESVPLVVDTLSGRTRVRFRLGAASQIDLDAFWVAAHANGVANGRTLAQALDTRADPVGDPDATSLPAAVNPLALLCQELLAGNAWLLVTDPSKFGPGAVPADLRAAAGPYTAVFEYATPVPALTRYDPS